MAYFKVHLNIISHREMLTNIKLCASIICSWLLIRPAAKIKHEEILTHHKSKDHKYYINLFKVKGITYTIVKNTFTGLPTVALCPLCLCTQPQYTQNKLL